MYSHSSVGNSWEGFVIEQIINMIPEDWHAFFYRTNAGAEINLLLFNEKNKPIAVEIKYSLTPKVTRGFWTALQDLSCKKAFVVYPGKETYPLDNNVFALPIKELNKIIENNNDNIFVSIS